MLRRAGMPLAPLVAVMPRVRNIFVLLLIVSALQCAFYYPRLPETVASHFDRAGYPNDWSSKVVFFGIVLAMTAMNAFVFLGIPGWMPRFSQRHWSLPNKSYWLAPERIEETHLYLRTQMLWFGVANMILMIGITRLAIEANFSSQPTLSPTAGHLLLAYFGFTAIWLTRFVIHFARPRADKGHGAEERNGQI